MTRDDWLTEAFYWHWRALWGASRGDRKFRDQAIDMLVWCLRKAEGLE
jgi:hypothetical protein